MDFYIEDKGLMGLSKKVDYKKIQNMEKRQENQGGQAFGAYTQLPKKRELPLLREICKCFKEVEQLIETISDREFWVVFTLKIEKVYLHLVHENIVIIIKKWR